ncbi:cytochrome P450 [Wallemia mellicola CBS 633.66]|uniref:Cytochrome P450 n=2 Tax=Wallemia mellicola TaxID=1708541 RepID=A0A4T0T5J8_9BASI|nr:cytochrome P450 [Wallemia mellicola CBS 633.66]TIB69519.1 hypothetical protein E3Q24_03330 [Wallemia mellicola]EIM20041.1 cytochrome P450 [Wallemia mellicola CBS 633.66]TIB82320.1 cytochrome P450 [Wallemia mellicola]TIB85145.1 cytochrome P450 [Wallemia mellicola]TIC02671.1 cytochrome P450 [Wallemia mellicola]|eukprot:XP_006959970.1 cytochrome P450 [Wallemia mellicola CBS 633.66]
MLQNLALLLISIACIIPINVLWQLLPKKNTSAPPLVFHWLPFIGSALDYAIDPLEFYRRNQERYGDVFTFILLGRPMTVVLGTKGNKALFASSATKLSASEAYTNLTSPVFGSGVVYDCSHSTFMSQKKFIRSGLSVTQFRAYVSMIVDEVELFMKNNLNGLSEGKIPAFETLAQLTLLTSAKTLQGHEVRKAFDEKLLSCLYHDLDKGFTPINMILPGLPLPVNRRRDVANKAVSDMFVRIIQARRKNPLPEEEYDMISTLNEKQYKDGTLLPDNHIAHLLISLLMAGQHTSSSVLSFAMLELGRRPDIWDALLKEQKENLSIHSTDDDINGNGCQLKPLEYEDFEKLPLLGAVLKETHRLHGPVHSVIRRALTDFEYIDDNDRAFIIPKGHNVVASPLYTQRSPEFWKNATDFDPYRWFKNDVYKESEEDIKVDYGFGMTSDPKESPYIPFGAGSHRCIGEQFATLQLMVILSTFVRKLEIKTEGEMPNHNYRTMIISPLSPDNIIYRTRKF